MRAYERLIRYAAIHTASSEESESVPSTKRQFDLASVLKEELIRLGVQDVYVDNHCYVYGRIPALAGYEDVPRIGFIAHLDTVPDFSGENVKPRLIRSYDGGSIPLGESGRVLRPEDFPHLTRLKGDDLIVTDGTTVLGADDKAGVAEIMTMAERLLTEDLPHGTVSVCFTPDEEIGHGAALLDLDRFAASLAYTVDGGEAGEIEYENFNAASANVEISGFNVHPGSAKDTMINASLAAVEFHQMLPSGDNPRDTEGYEGFFHLTRIQGNVEKAVLNYIIRDHDKGAFEARKKALLHIEKLLNARYGPDTVKVTLQDQYRNMKEIVDEHFEVVEKAQTAIRACGLEPKTIPIRGGTDGAQLSFRGLPCPNLATGSYGHHGPYEHASVQQMDQCVEILCRIAGEFCRR